MGTPTVRRGHARAQEFLCAVRPAESKARWRPWHRWGNDKPQVDSIYSDSLSLPTFLGDRSTLSRGDVRGTAMGRNDDADQRGEPKQL